MTSITTLIDKIRNVPILTRTMNRIINTDDGTSTSTITSTIHNCFWHSGREVQALSVGAHRVLFGVHGSKDVGVVAEDASEALGVQALGDEVAAPGGEGLLDVRVHGAGELAVLLRQPRDRLWVNSVQADMEKRNHSMKCRIS